MLRIFLNELVLIQIFDMIDSSMIETLNDIFLLNLFGVMPPVFSYLLCCAGAIFAGTVVGKEREKAQKAAGLRTFAMVALGACVFTLTSRLVLGEGIFTDGARIPAQIVSGVGFLGAGAVFRSGRIVTGLTTAAGIWATAAVGLVFGLGFFTFGICITFMIFILLWIHAFMDRKNFALLDSVSYHIHVNAEDGKGVVIIEELIREWGHQLEAIESSESRTRMVWQVKLSCNHRPHQRFLSELARQSYVVKLVKNV
jgi:putative Mg2+ transporter-C (MgtC) family protein